MSGRARLFARPFKVRLIGLSTSTLFRIFMPNAIPPAPPSPVTSGSLGFQDGHKKSTPEQGSPRGEKRPYKGHGSPTGSAHFLARMKRESSVSEAGTQTSGTEKKEGSTRLRNALKKALSQEDEAAALKELESDLPDIFVEHSYFKITPGYLPRAMQSVLYKAIQKLPLNCKELEICLDPDKGKDLEGRHSADRYTIKEHSLAIRRVDQSAHDDLKIFVDYSNFSLGDEEIEEVLQPLSGHSKIASLNLSGQEEGISSRGVKAIEKLVAEGGGLQEVDLTYCALDDESAEAIAGLLKHAGVAVKLFYNNLGPGTVRALANAMTKPDFQRTDIDLCCDTYEDLGNEEAKLIAQALKQCKVDTVGIGGKKMTGQAMVHFALAIQRQNSKLKSLILEKVKITDSYHFRILMSSISHQNSLLESFMLRDVELSDEHIPSLIRTITTPGCRLKYLVLSMGKVSDEKAQEFREAIEDDSRSSLEAYCIRNFGSKDEVLIKGREALELKFPGYFAFDYST